METSDMECWSMLEQSAACRIQISFTGRQPLMLISTPIDGLSGRRLRAFFTGLSDEGLENTAALIMVMRIPHWLPVLSSDTLDGPLRERDALVSPFVLQPSVIRRRQSASHRVRTSVIGPPAQTWCALSSVGHDRSAGVSADVWMTTTLHTINLVASRSGVTDKDRSSSWS
jgi:hypothetical protein